MMYVITGLILLAIAILSLRLRLRAEISADHRLLALLLGRSGLVWNYAAGSGEWRLFGLTIHRFSIDRADDHDGPKEKKKREAATGRSTIKSKKRRKRPVQYWLQIMPDSMRAIGRCSLAILRSATVEQLEAEIEGGFEEPDLTGQAFGYYQAALAAVPVVMSRVTFIPDWTGESFRGSARVAVAIPLYAILARSLLLLWDLPLKKIIKLAIGTKEGAQDGK